MRKTLLILFVLFIAQSIDAQKNGFVCTGNNVNVRKGPGKQYAIYDVEYGHKRQLMKGDIVANEGKRENGFCLISGPREWGGDERDGWVSSQYLRPVTICPRCDGTKSENIGKVDIDLIDCRGCHGKGYVRH